MFKRIKQFFLTILATVLFPYSNARPYVNATINKLARQHEAKMPKRTYSPRRSYGTFNKNPPTGDVPMEQEEPEVPVNPPAQDPPAANLGDGPARPANVDNTGTGPIQKKPEKFQLDVFNKDKGKFKRFIRYHRGPSPFYKVISALVDKVDDQTLEGEPEKVTKWKRLVQELKWACKFSCYKVHWATDELLECTPSESDNDNEVDIVDDMDPTGQRGKYHFYDDTLIYRICHKLNDNKEVGIFERIRNRSAYAQFNDFFEGLGKAIRSVNYYLHIENQFNPPIKNPGLKGYFNIDKLLSYFTALPEQKDEKLAFGRVSVNNSRAPSSSPSPAASPRPHTPSYQEEAYRKLQESEAARIRADERHEAERKSQLERFELEKKLALMEAERKSQLERLEAERKSQLERFELEKKIALMEAERRIKKETKEKLKEKYNGQVIYSAAPGQRFFDSQQNSAVSQFTPTPGLTPDHLNITTPVPNTAPINIPPSAYGSRPN